MDGAPACSLEIASCPSCKSWIHRVMESVCDAPPEKSTSAPVVRVKDILGCPRFNLTFDEEVCVDHVMLSGLLQSMHNSDPTLISRQADNDLAKHVLDVGADVRIGQLAEDRSEEHTSELQSQFHI